MKTDRLYHLASELCKEFLNISLLEVASFGAFEVNGHLIVLKSNLSSLQTKEMIIKKDYIRYNQKPKPFSTHSELLYRNVIFGPNVLKLRGKIILAELMHLLK